MQQATVGESNKEVVFSVRDCREEGCVKLTVDGIKDVALYLSAQQARALACNLIQHAYRAEVKNDPK